VDHPNAESVLAGGSTQVFAQFRKSRLFDDRIAFVAQKGSFCRCPELLRSADVYRLENAREMRRKQNDSDLVDSKDPHRLQAASSGSVVQEECSRLPLQAVPSPVALDPLAHPLRQLPKYESSHPSRPGLRQVGLLAMDLGEPPLDAGKTRHHDERERAVSKTVELETLVKCGSFAPRSRNSLHPETLSLEVELYFPKCC
jgi:hypothetical protein